MNGKKVQFKMRQVAPAITVVKYLLDGVLSLLVTDVEVQGLDPEMLKPPVVHAQQHVSYLDPFVTAVTLKIEKTPLPYVAAGSNLMGGIIGQLAANMGTIPIDRGRIEAGERTYIYAASMIAEELLKRGNSFMFYPSGTRSRNGLPEYSLNSESLSIFANPIQRSAETIKGLELIVSAITYDYNMDVEEFERENREGTQPHGGFVDTVANYTGLGKGELWMRVLSRMPKKENGSIPQGFGKARLVFSEPIQLEEYKDRAFKKALRDEVYRRMKDAIVVTDTALVMTSLRDGELTRSELVDEVGELQCRLAESCARMDCRSPQEAVDYVQHLLAPRGVALTFRDWKFSANPFIARYYVNNIRHYLERAKTAN